MIAAEYFRAPDRCDRSVLTLAKIHQTSEFIRHNPVKRTLQGGGVSQGVMVMKLNTPGIGRISAEAGAEFAVFDMEHSG